MFGFKLERAPAPLLQRFAIPIVAVAITFILASILILVAGANPLEVFYEILIKPFSKRTSRIEILVQATPLILTGVAVAFAFAAGYYNIGAEGQLYAGALAAALVGPKLAALPSVLAIIIMLLAGFVAGALWALLPALLKVKLKVDEVVTTLLLNSVILFFISALLNGVWRDPISGWPKSPAIARSAEFPQIIARSRLHFGFIIALLSLLVLWWVLKRTRFGLELKAVGLGQDAARFMNIKVAKTMLTAALISGGIAGIAGVSEVAGLHHYLIDGISPGYGYTGIIVATFGSLNAIGIAFAALFLALIDTGSLSASRSLGIPAYLGDVIQATLLLATLVALLLNNYRIRRKNV